MNNEYHITRVEPIEPHWPKGAWSVYRITGDEIVNRTIYKRVNPKGWYEGEVIARHSWCGYLGMVERLDQVIELIESNYN